MVCQGFALGFAYLVCTDPAAPPDTFCQIYKPVMWSRNDTRVTKDQVDTNNKKWKKLCPAGAKK